MNDGFIVNKKIGDLKDKEKIRTISYDFKNSKYAISNSEVIKQEQEKDFYEVILSSGEKVQCSMEHKLFVYEDGTIKERQLKNIKEGDLLICKKDNSDKYRCPKVFYLKGAFDGDGHYNPKGTISFNVTDYDFLLEVQSLIKKIFNLDVNIINHVEATARTKQQWRINLCTINSLGFNPCDFFKSLVPESSEEKIEYLRGLFDAEGSVGICNRHIKKSNGKEYNGKEKWLTLSQKDIDKLELWSSYLKEYGIEAIKIYKKDSRSFLHIRNNYSISQFNKLIGFKIKRKQDMLNQIIANSSRHKLSKQDYEKVVDIYNNTKFGTTYLGFMFGRSSQAIKMALRQRGIKMIDKKNKPISSSDIQYAENKIGYKIPFKINRNKLSSELHNTYIEEKTINQFNISEIDGIRNLKNQINFNMADKYFNRTMFLMPLSIQQVPSLELQQFQIDLNKSNLITKQITSIKFHNREKGYDLYTEDYHNFLLSNSILSHNSTACLQTAYFVAWQLAGGSMAKEESTGKWFVSAKPNKIIHFNLEENVVFTPSDLQLRARELYTKYGRNQVIIYDEGRAGLDSAAAMSAINKAMQDFFQECGQYGHVILVVLPNFFKLHEDYAISRSIFLVDVFTNKRMERGFFNFYNEAQKENLYIAGKKKAGTQSKYSGARPSFTGRFSPFLPIDKEKYEAAKQEAIKQKDVKDIEKKWKRQRDGALLMLHKHLGMGADEIATELAKITDIAINANMVRFGIRAITKKPITDIT